MARPYGLELLQALDNEMDGRLGTELARVCVRANLPTQHLASVFGVSRMTIHSWFRGKPIRSARHGAIESFMNKVEDDIKTGILPAINLKKAKVYLAQVRKTFKSK